METIQRDRVVKETFLLLLIPRMFLISVAWIRKHWQVVLIVLLAVALVLVILIPVHCGGRGTTPAVVPDVQTQTQTQTPALAPETTKVIVVTEATHMQVLQYLRVWFPNATPRGVSSSSYQMVELEKSDIEHFLNNDERLGMDRHDAVYHLISEFSESDWKNIPVGFLKSDSSYHNLIIGVKENKYILFGVDPQTNEIWEIKSPVTEKCSVIF